MKVENPQKSRPLLGAHVSIAGGVENSPKNGFDLTCDCIQIFSKNQSQWKSNPLSDKNISGFREGLEKYNLKSVLIHDSYLINLASPDPAKHKMSLDAFIDEIDRADQLGVRQLVFHPGSAMESSEDQGLSKIAASLNSAISQRPHSQVRLLLETTAGQGTNLGCKFEHLAQIIHQVEDKSRMGVCFDTAHALAGGYDLRSPENYPQVWEKFGQIIGLDYLAAFHLNDSKKDLSTRVDRHENIGKGFIGAGMFKMLLNDPRFAGLSMYLETPGGDQAYLDDLKTLRSLFL